MTDTTSGFRAVEPPRDRALRRRLPARLPRGRGDRARLPAPAAPRRGAGHHARARGRPLVHHRAPLGSTTWARSARALRRPLPRAPALAETDDPAQASRSSRRSPSLVLLRVVLELIRRRRLQERYALLWLVTGVVMLVLALWRGGLDTLADARRHRLPAVGALRRRGRLHPRRAAALLDRDLAPLGAEPDPRAAARAARGRRPRRSGRRRTRARRRGSRRSAGWRCGRRAAPPGSS